MNSPVCVIVGAGPGNGRALARKFASKGHAVALLARDAAKLEALAGEVDGAEAFTCDVTDDDSVAAAFDALRARLGPVAVLCYNAGGGSWGTIDQTTVAAMHEAWQVNVAGLLRCSQAVLPDMRQHGGGQIVVTGATASLRGGANFTAFASAKAAQRSLAQSMARALGREKIHVSLVIVDGVIDLPRTRELLPDKPADSFMQAEDIAETAFHLTQQRPSAWSFEVDLRPWNENW